MLDLNLLKVLDVLLEERSVSRTASRLERTQSAVSHALARLRRELGDDLLRRRAKGLEPTPRALEIAPALHAALVQLQGALAPPDFNPAASTRRAADTGACVKRRPPHAPMSGRTGATG